MVVVLKPTSKRLKQVIREFGSEWLFIARKSMQCFGGREGIQIKSMCGKHTRNVELSDIDQKED